MPPPRLGPLGWARVILRGLPLGLITFGCLALLLLVRLVERPLCGHHRPVTPFITQFVCKAAFLCLGMKHRTHGTPMRHRGAIVANHASWLDIYALNAPQRIYYVAKSEVAGWPGIGWLARATGTVFIRRDRREAKAQQAVFEERLRMNHRLLFFPEGTSTDGLRVLPFKPTLFQAFYTHDMPEILHIQPVTVAYQAPPGEDPRFYGWWGDMDFGSGLLRVLGARRQGAVEIVFHAPIPVAGAGGRKALAAACEAAVRDGLKPRLGSGHRP
ncbi:1-acyl-sn-glycerol-3-phosphate acyltransferase [Oceanicola sp. D3]|uniref:lysophospholipid acyltransferase family protein n=1 Tax=Oceanicola sp. D3 TaxID=2587163 RepID=UPI00111E8B08|nr:lysophospholipid acyltransferase family protein [Oceanicola sp. D3]QDC11589.1 1-acyl-sn-glycerol-3-phosphate acyltransferase [Oceanicola sp. D3]